MCWFPRRAFNKIVLGPGAPVNLPATNEQVLMDWTQLDRPESIANLHAEVDALGGAGQIDQIAIESIIQPGNSGVVRAVQMVTLTTGQAADISDAGHRAGYARVLATSTAGNIQGRARMIVSYAG